MAPLQELSEKLTTALRAHVLIEEYISDNAMLAERPVEQGWLQLVLSVLDQDDLAIYNRITEPLIHGDMTEGFILRKYEVSWSEIRPRGEAWEIKTVIDDGTPFIYYAATARRAVYECVVELLIWPADQVWPWINK